MTTFQIDQQQARDTAANWGQNNPVLLAGTIGFETDTGLFKIGDGSSLWANLNYIGGKVVSGDGSPIGTVTPKYIGQTYVDTTNGQQFVAKGLTSSEWISNLSDTSGDTITGKTSPIDADEFLLFDSEAGGVSKVATGANMKTGLKIPSSDPTGVTGADAVTNIMSLTSAEYTAIGTPNASTLYIITDA